MYDSLTASEIEAELTARGYYKITETAPAPRSAQPVTESPSTDIIQSITTGKGVSVWIFLLIGAVSLILMEGIKEGD